MGRTSCSIAATLEAIGDRWTLLISAQRVSRQPPLQRNPTGSGNRQEPAGRPPEPIGGTGRAGESAVPGETGAARVSTVPKGADLSPALIALMKWGDRWYAAGGAPTVLVHDQCDTAIGTTGAVSRPVKQTSRRATFEVDPDRVVRKGTLERFQQPTVELLAQASEIRDSSLGSQVTYSPKVFIPLDHVVPGPVRVLHLRPAAGQTRVAVPLAGARCSRSPNGARAGCHEALFTLGERPELRYPAAASGWRTTATNQPSTTWRPWRNGSGRDRPAAPRQCRCPVPTNWNYFERSHPARA